MRAKDQLGAPAHLLVKSPAHRAGRAVDVAYMALYLASDEAAFVTGGTFVIDGGVTAR